MTALVVDSGMQARLGAVTEPIEVRDASGRKLGYFVPGAAIDSALYAKVKSPISEEELRRRYAEPGGSSLSEIIQQLKRQ